jgi:hypothetical protein
MMMNACMMQSVKFWVSPTLPQTKACIDGLYGCGLVRLMVLPIWKILFGNRQDHQNWNVKICTILLETRF